MSLPTGVWCVNAVLINHKTVMNNEGFRFLNVTDDEMSIEPAGIKFQFTQKNDAGAVLESDGELFYARFSQSQECCAIELTRPGFQELLLFEAELVASAELAEIV